MATERALELVALELGHVDAVGGEAAHRLVERGRHVAHAEDEGGDDRAVAGLGVVGLGGEHDEARRVVLLVLDVVHEDLRGRRSRRRARRRWPRASGSLASRDHARGAGGVGLRHRLEAELAQRAAALAERLRVAEHALDGLQRRARQRHQLVAHAQEVLADDVAARRRAAGGGCRRRAPRPSSRSGSWRSARRRPSPPPAHPRRWRRRPARGRGTPRGRPDASWRRARPDRRCARRRIWSSWHHALGAVRAGRGYRQWKRWSRSMPVPSDGPQVHFRSSRLARDVEGSSQTRWYRCDWRLPTYLRRGVDVD